MLAGAVAVFVMFFCPGLGFASPDTAAVAGAVEDHSGYLQDILVALMLILLLGKLGGDLMIRIGQPAVLGELLFGIILGNIAVFCPAAAAFLHVDRFTEPHVKFFIEILSEIGVMLLLFEVGLESTVREMMSVGWSSLLVAVLGVVAPVALGFGVGEIFMKDEPYTVHLFLGAVLAATSVGITARVINDIGQIHRRESKIILGAAVIDDVLGLIVMAVATGMVNAVNQGTTLNVMSLVIIVLKSLVFFLVAMGIGGLLTRKLFALAGYLRGEGLLLTVSLLWMFFVAWVGTLIGLAPIIGAFAAGLVLEDIAVKDMQKREKTTMAEIMRPLSTFLVPVFFVRMGMQVDLRTFADSKILAFATALTLAAIIGKQICALGVLERGLNRLAVGVGMIPRGEVGLIVAGIGATMRTAEGHPVISPAAFSATVIMVIVTTMITPPLLTAVFKRPVGNKKDQPQQPPSHKG